MQENFRLIIRWDAIPLRMQLAGTYNPVQPTFTTRTPTAGAAARLQYRRILKKIHTIFAIQTAPKPSPWGPARFYGTDRPASHVVGITATCVLFIRR